MPLSADNFNLIIKYFNASEDLKTAKTDIEKFLSQYEDRDFVKYVKDIYETPLDEKLIIDLLLALNIPLDQWVLYLASPMSLDHLFNELSKNAIGTFPQLPWLIDRIERKRLYKQLKDLCSVLIPILLILIIPFLCCAQEVLELFHILIQTANIIPLTGIGFALSILGISVYFNKSDHRTPIEKIKADYYFLLISNALNIVGKIILMFSHAIAVTLAQYFFIASALVHVIKQIYHLRVLYREKKALGDCEPSSSILIYQSYARLHFDCLKQRNELIISIVSAALVATLVFSCLIFPPGALLTIAISASTLFVYLLEQAALKMNDKIIVSLLHTNLEDIAKWRIEEKNIAEREKQSGERPEGVDSSKAIRFKKMCSVADFNTGPSTLTLQTSQNRLERLEQPYSYLTNSQRSLRTIKQRLEKPTQSTATSKDDTLNRFFKYYCPEKESITKTHLLPLSLYPA